MSETANPHKGHRARMRKKFIENGIETFAPHEVLEMLLYYAYPQRNTNDIAHRLLNKFGSLEGVFEADVKSLMTVDGVGEGAAVLLRMQSELFRYYEREKINGARKAKITPSNVQKYIIPLFYGHTDEIFCMMSLDKDSRLISCNTLSKGTKDSVAIYPREVVKIAIENNASYVILAHNHPNGLIAPSEADKKSTVLIGKALDFVNVRLIDHLIVSGDRCMSMKKDYDFIN